MLVGKTIRMIRISRDLSQGKLARALGVTAGYLSLVEKDRREPSLGFLRKVASYFNIPVGFLLLEDTNRLKFTADQRRLLNEIRHKLLDYIIFRQSGDGKRGRQLSHKQ